MAKYITEDDIEIAVLDRLSHPDFGYDIIKCDADPSKRENLDDGTGRSSKKECVLPCVLKASLVKINPHIPESIIDDVAKTLIRDFTGTDIVATNYDLYNKIRNQIKVKVRRNGRDDFDFVKLVDFDTPTNNTFTAVSQMWIQGKLYWRRPDVLIFVNGLPLVFIELKNSVVKVEEAYNKNLQDYIKDIPNLFAFNQICVLSNGLETRLGAFNATYDYFFEWLKVDSEKEKPDRAGIRDSGVSIVYFIDGLLKKERLVDYIENFVLFDNRKYKIIAKNHQYLGVNNLVRAVERKEELKGKLGVFWHTQGSGKSYSMVMFARKVKRKITGNFTFLVITDRDDLDTQIHKNFVRTEVIGNNDECQPKNGEQLRDFLQKNKEFVFTLIHKFRYDKTKKYPVLSTRNDIFVMVDEAHRTQYKDLAENMRAALPNANFIAFTGTPLLGSKRLTNQWFGDYVSEYNFAQSVEDGSTVPLFYSRRVPEVGLTNDFLDDDVVDIIEEENLNDDEARLLENSASRILEVIKRDDRLEKIARDIAHHFPRRGFLGKGMVVSVDKYTAVTMYNKVQHYWAEEKKTIIAERNTAKTKDDRARLTAILDYMNHVEMAVIISEEADEVKKFASKGLDITTHRAKMNAITVDGKDIEDRFKEPNDKLQLVFVCAMWLTGFDVKNLSTLYLDKPMKSHTLMQAIARVNRVFRDKEGGLVVDYVGIATALKQAMNDYTVRDRKNYGDTDVGKVAYPKFLEKLSRCQDLFHGYDYHSFNTGSDLDRAKTISGAVNFIIAPAREGDKEEFLKEALMLHQSLSLCSSLVDEQLRIEAAFFEAVRVLVMRISNQGSGGKTISLPEMNARINELLKHSIKSDGVINLFSDVKEEFSLFDPKFLEDVAKMKEKNLAVELLKKLIAEQIHIYRRTNVVKSEKFSEIIQRTMNAYLNGMLTNEQVIEELMKMAKDIANATKAGQEMGLTADELAFYDALTKPQAVKDFYENSELIAITKELTETLRKNKSIDWQKKDSARARMRMLIKKLLKSHRYPPEGMEDAVQTVMTQCELWTDNVFD